MIRKFSFLLFFLLITSCSSYNSIDSFYAAHKNDNQVTAIRVPQFMLSLISDISPEMKSLVGNTKDLRYMQFPSATESRTNFLNSQMNSITGTSFIEVFRKNDETKRNVISIREKRDVVKEILIYNNNNINGSFLYFNGNFDPIKVRNMAQSDQFEKLSNGLVNQFSLQTPSINQN
ncbi:hypothetical protein GGR42_000063 [Saonia flava]|uniref:DUF4252 domain-containing protein n=1 Tax=Saonia flava TaxID=523696 RepID=A0A846QND0_9FLAO|nr:DUF4252 domain-containing protein [Saonia flava]NJB69601.1 hypothetical protein [Saonia flava]